MDEKTQLENLLRKYKPGDELEIRIGNFEETIDRGRQRTDFRPYIGEFSYNYLLRNYFEPAKGKKRVVNQIINTYRNNIRRLQNIDTADVELIKKERKDKVDLREKGIRIALSSEESITQMPRERPLSEKGRIRSSFENDEKTVRYDITKDTFRNGIDYQVEIEFIVKPDLKTLEEMIETATDIRKMLWGFRRLISKFNNFFISQFHGKPSEIPYTAGKKPRDLRLYNIPYLEKYIIYPKFDGVAFFLMFVEGGGYYINRTDIEEIYEEITELNDTVIMGELVNNPNGGEIFFSLDMPWYKGEDLQRQPFLKRLEQLNEALEVLDDKGAVLVPIFHEKYPADSIKLANKYLAETKFAQDGLVLIPNNLPYANNFNYKWKPHGELTIDFTVSRNNDGTFNLYSYGSRNQPVFFGTTRIPVENIRKLTGNETLPTNTVIEFVFSDGNFIPKRLRPDKVKPNFIVVAQNIWEVIKNPLNMEDLIRASEVSTIIKGEPLVDIVRKVCNFLTLFPENPEPRIFDNLREYINTDIITNAFYRATIRGVEIGKGFQPLIKILQEYFNIKLIPKFIKILIPPPNGKINLIELGSGLDNINLPKEFTDKFNRVDKNIISAKAGLDLIRSKSNKQLSDILFTVDLFRDLKNKIRNEFNGQVVTNAWLKIYEIAIQMSPLIRKDSITMFSNAELPGAFICSVNQYVKTIIKKEFEWVASSLHPGTQQRESESDILGDQYGLYECNRDRWLMDDPTQSSTKTPNNGDVTSASNVVNLAERVRSRLGVEGVEFYTSDAGIDVSKDYAKQEILNMHIHFGQAVSGLLALKEGGFFVVKHYTLNQPFTISLIITLSYFFREFYIVKPMTSRPANSETYLVGNGFKGISQNEIGILLSRLSDFEKLPLLRLGSPAVRNTIEAIYNAVVEIHEKQQISFLNEVVEFHKRFGNKIGDLRNNLRGVKSDVQKTWLRSNPVHKISAEQQILQKVGDRCAKPSETYYVETTRPTGIGNLRKFHNDIKWHLYKTYLRYRGNILELAAGRGGDLEKLKRQKVNYALLVDNNEEELRRARERHRQRNGTRIDFMVGDARKNLTVNIRKHMVENNIGAFDLVSIQFAFHYFFESIETFENIFKNVNTYLSRGGYFISTFLDGRAVFNLLRFKDEFVAKTEDGSILFKIKKKYREPKIFGTKIEVYGETIGSHDEYLVDTDFVVRYFQNHGYRLIDTRMFNVQAWQQMQKRFPLSNPEIAYSSLNRYLVLQKLF